MRRRPTIKYVDFHLSDSEADRRLYRASQPKARRFALRDEPSRELRHDRTPWEQ